MHIMQSQYENLFYNFKIKEIS